jgi:hypothetical protein
MYLYSLQNKALKNKEKFCIKATSFLGESDLWLSYIGRKIRENTNPESCRIFIYSSASQLFKNESAIIEHAQKDPKYNVYILEESKLSSIFDKLLPEFQKTIKNPADSFAIFEEYCCKLIVDSGEKIEDDNPFPFMNFIGSLQKIEAYEAWMQLIIDSAISIPNVDGKEKEKSAREIIKKATQNAPNRDSDS